ncbi:MAG: sigma-54-dependent Fis family transcriptional regulator [Gallionellales bacterium RIFCSPLOWO2_12_FULL_59_22]|nr:MAG: sigma-54-dependent Fis family transcriptional regulator [Gallionellales bacterium RIFCSPLOWO2_02_FULL_59_110]OGT04799.1 MAG: sigma-54-dependent Fis family transcriptional regulator [Gallionellales bacterium RIFCSPLOWO2_02_58_13]OGT13877.1 MAG: sigma-54-dependent Fis family transcriptional regulator [Gallionellales bacterium RIFCSPLOWO2_12_FULL_59_22]
MLTLSGLKQFLDNLEEGIVFLDQERHVVAVNEAASRMLGQDHDAIFNKLCPSLFQGTSCARSCEKRGFCTLMADAKGGKKIQDLVVQRPDGELIPLRMWAMVLPSEEQLAYCAVVLRDRSREMQLQEEASNRMHLGGLVGNSAVMQELFAHILRAAASEASILITGESGTGKELVARALHDNSSRAKGPYVRVHCAAFPEHLLEGELFGHARGAFTGATTAREGRFEAAHGGTLLLDEIGEVPLNIQVKLLRVLQEREIERLGENQPRKVDVRIIAATHRDLPAMVASGDFRADLYYRLRVLPLHLPALRERREDIPLLANSMLANILARNQGRDLQLSGEAFAALSAYGWPGNVRELGNALEYAAVHADGTAILTRHLPPEIQETAHRQAVNLQPAAAPAQAVQFTQRYYRASAQQPGQEKEMLLLALQETGGNKAAAAEKLGMSRTTLWKKLKQHGID